MRLTRCLESLYEFYGMHHTLRSVELAETKATQMMWTIHNRYSNYCFIITLFLLKIVLALCNPRIIVIGGGVLCGEIRPDVPVLSLCLLLLLLDRTFD